jgi:adenine-specific DNA-methyltransferase
MGWDMAVTKVDIEDGVNGGSEGSDGQASAWLAVKKLTSRFRANHSHFMSSSYQEAEVRAEFLNKLFIALGWDVLHDLQHDPYRQEVKIERSDHRARGRADYAFSVGPTYQRVRFLLEAKRPQPDILTPDNCFQAIRYSWPLGLPIVVLSDFNNTHILDSRFKPSINSVLTRVVASWNYEEFENEESFARFYWLLSREAVASGSIERFTETILPETSVATRQYSLFPADTRDFDDDFLAKLDGWRADLAHIMKKARPTLTGTQLTECVQRCLDRLIFTRFLEDKGIEENSIIAAYGASKRPAWEDFMRSSRRLDAVYNGIVFKPHPVLDDPQFRPDSGSFQAICDELTDSHSPYQFSSIPVEILGRIYERFLGKVVHTRGQVASVVEKENVRKAGGVFYTPGYVVDFMVERSLGPKVANLSVDEILKLRVIDTSCGSGSFLIAVFSFLMDAIVGRYRADHSKAKKGRIELRDNDVHLTMAFKNEILTKCIFGVDIDAQAVEVAQLSLYLKLLEDETTYSAHQQQMQMGVALLPSLGSNIVEGNSLLTLDEDLFADARARELKSLDFKDAFSNVFAQGGFDLLIGNPPYIKEYTNKEAFDHLRGSPYYEGKMDIWYMFACRGLEWLKAESGTLALIATNNWTTNAGAKKLRSLITTSARIELLVDFADFKVFRDAGIQTMILVATRSAKLRKYKFDYRRLTSKRPDLAAARALIEKAQGSGLSYLEPTLDRAREPSSAMTFSSASRTELLDRIEKRGTFRLNGNDELTQGIVPNPDVVTARSINLLPAQRRVREGIKVGDGVFVVDRHHFTKPIKAELNYLKDLIEPADVERYIIARKPSRKLIYSVRNRHRDDTPPERIMAHLRKFREIMQARRETQSGSHEWHHLHWPRAEKFFAKGPKILAVRKCAVPTFVYTEDELYVMMAFNIIRSDRINLKFLTAVLNSKVIEFWLRNRGKMQGNNFQVDGEPLCNLPVVCPSADEQSSVAADVNRLLQRREALVEASTSSDVERAERMIRTASDAIERKVAELYGLSEADIAMINATSEAEA